VTRRGLLTATVAALALYACAEPPKPQPHYVLGAPYQAGGVWHYPRESFALDETGVAAIQAAPASKLTTDGEVYDPGAMAGAHATLQLPAIVRITNLDNGLQVVIRLNDRGSGNPGRVVEVTPRVAQLLQFAASGRGSDGAASGGAASGSAASGGLALVRVEVLSQESQDAAQAMHGAPTLAVETAPRAAIESADLPPPSDTGSASGSVTGSASGAAAKPATAAVAGAAEPVLPPPLPERLTRVAVTPHQIIVRLDSFTEFQYARAQQAKMAAAGAHIVTLREGRTKRYRVDVGPFETIAQADAVQQRALGVGIPDARIVVD